MSEEFDALQFHKYVHEQISGIPLHLDTKISILGGAGIASLWFTLGLAKDLKFVGFDGYPGHVVAFGLMSLAILGFFGSLTACMVALWARRSGNISSLASFVGIANCTDESDYSTRVNALQRQDFSVEIARHNYELTEIITRKVYWTNHALMSLAAGLTGACGAFAWIIYDR